MTRAAIFFQASHFRIFGQDAAVSDDPLHNPHDKLFKAGFSDPATAAAFLREQLPPAVCARIDWKRMELEPGSFVSAQMRERHSDLLFSAPFADSKAFVYLLFEHQSSFDYWLGLRLLEYMLLIWQEYLKKHPESRALPVILPVVLAQNDRVWQVKTQFADLLDVPSELRAELKPLLPDFCFQLKQLAEMPFEAIRGTPAGILVLRTMKAERLEKLLDAVVWDESLLVSVPRVLLKQWLRYILGTDIDKAAFETNLRQIQELETRTDVMTLAQQYHNEGLQKGRQEGRQEHVIEALEIRFERVPEGLAEAVRDIRDEALLRSLLRTAIRCASLEDFAAEL
jgi:predicted transposase/invertase (TIGR01784 family)